MHYSFVQEFVGDPVDGVTLLLELLRSVQLTQASHTGRVPPAVLRRCLLDEHSCLQCLRSCLRCQDAPRRFASSPAGLFTLAVCIMSNVNKSRILALEVSTHLSLSLSSYRFYCFFCTCFRCYSSSRANCHLILLSDKFSRPHFHFRCYLILS